MSQKTQTDGGALNAGIRYRIFSMPQGKARIRAKKGGQAQVDLGPLETMLDCEYAARTIARAIASGKDPKGDLTRALAAVSRLAWMKLSAKHLELKGINMGLDGGTRVNLTVNDFADAYRDVVAELETVKTQLAALQDRPRPPRPSVN